MVIFQGKIPSESDSAPVFSERLRIRIRNLHAGKHLLSQATMSVCAKGFMSTSNALKSAGQNFSENHNPFPFGDLMKPPNAGLRVMSTRICCCIAVLTKIGIGSRSVKMIC